MNRKTQSDSIVVQDRTSRRNFIRAGTAFVVAGAALVAGRRSMASDCDQSEQQHARCSDQDTGEAADPTGCGRCGRLAPTSMPSTPGKGQGDKVTRVKKIVV